MKYCDMCSIPSICSERRKCRYAGTPGTGKLIARRSAAACSPSSGGQEPEQGECGITHYAGCACHEQGWENKWKTAIELAARATVELDKARAALSAIEERYIDGCDTYEDWKFMGDTARKFFFPENANVDLPDTAAQDSASKSNNPAVSG